MKRKAVAILMGAILIGSVLPVSAEIYNSPEADKKKVEQYYYQEEPEETSPKTDHDGTEETEGVIEQKEPVQNKDDKETSITVLDEEEQDISLISIVLGGGGLAGGAICFVGFKRRNNKKN